MAGEARCAACHADCSSCVGPGKDQCTVCAGNLMIMVPSSSAGVSGSCSSVYDTKGKVKSEFSTRMDTPTIRNNKKSGVTYFSIQDYKVGRRSPRRRASKALRRKVQVSLTSTTLSRIEALGSRFRYQDLCRVNYEARDKSVREDVDFTVSTSVSAEKDSLDFSFNMINRKIQTITATFTFVNNNYFFKNIPNMSPASRILQGFGTTTQDLINNTPLIANSTFRATITTQDYDDWAADVMTVLGAVLRVVIYLAVIIATISMIILTFKKPKNNLVRIANYLEFVTAFSWTVKIAFIPALYTIYELVFLDELAKVNTQLMGEVVQEREVRSSLGSNNKFGEYFIPVLVVNSAITAFGLLAVFLIAIGVVKAVSLVKNSKKKVQRPSSSQGRDKIKDKKNSPFLDLLKLSTALVLPTIYFYSLVEVTWNTREGDTNRTESKLSFFFSMLTLGVITLGLGVGWVVYLIIFEKRRNKLGLVGIQTPQKVTNNPRNQEEEFDTANKIRIINHGGMFTGRIDDEKAHKEEDGGRSLFELWRNWISLLRFALMMVVVTTQQDSRGACLAWLVCIQSAGLLGFGVLCWLKKKKPNNLVFVYEGCLTLLILVLVTTEIPSNRVERKIFNILPTILIPILIYSSIGIKTAQIYT